MTYVKAPRPVCPVKFVARPNSPIVERVSTNYTHSRNEMLQFLPREARSVLDVGCSTGAFGIELRKHCADLRLVGVEPNPEAGEVASGVYDHVSIGRFPDIQDDLPAGDRYDVIYFNDVLEHMPEPELAMRAARTFLAEGGMMIASIPNVRHISVLGPLIVRDDFKYRASGILDTTHLRFFTNRSIRRLYESEGWQITRMQGINRVLHIAEDRRRPWIGWLGRLSGGRTDAFFFVQYVVVAQPLPSARPGVGGRSL